MNNHQTLAQKIAESKRAQLARLQGKKELHAERAQEIWNLRLENRSAAELRSVEFDLTENHHLDLYVTPEWLAADMVERCNDPIFDGALWCEPSAGTGRIVQAMVDAGQVPFCVELNYNVAEHLRKKFPNLVIYNRDFLDMSAEAQIIPAQKCYDCRTNPPTIRHTPEQRIAPALADVFIMNPPFSNGQDIAHVRHAYKYLGEGGRIVAVMSESAFTQSYNRAKQFQAWLDTVCSQVEKLPADTFKESGANVATRLVQIDK